MSGDIFFFIYTTRQASFTEELRKLSKMSFFKKRKLKKVAFRPRKF